MKKFSLVIIVIILALLLTPRVISTLPNGSENNPTIETISNTTDTPNVAYDVIVIGGEPEGISAAVSAARNGMKTLLIEDSPNIGGLMTRGWLNSIDMNYDPNGEILNKGIFYEFYQMLEGDSFNINTAQNAFNKLVGAEENIDVLLNAQNIEPILDGSKITGVNLIHNNENKVITASTFIDATQDADFAYDAGVPFTIGQEDYLGSYQSMASTLVFQLDNIDWDKITKALKKDGSPHTGSNEVSAWGFYEQMKEYQPRDPDIGVRGLNIGRVDNDSILINALYIYGIDGLNEQEKQEGIEKAKKELEYLVPFMRENIPGFKNAEFADVAPELYIRETRHMDGLYRLTIDDVLENRDFDDRIAFGSYPVDIQAISPDRPGYIVGNPKQYAIPFRSIVPPNISNLLVVGRSASYDSLAHGSARVIPVGMATGEAAGVAAQYAIKNELTFQEIAKNSNDISNIQTTLNNQGMELYPFSYEEPVTNHWAYEGVKFFRQLGMISAGYNNDYRLENKINTKSLNSIIYNANIRLDSPFNYQYGINGENQEVTKELFAQEIFKLLGRDYKDAYTELLELDILSPELETQIESSPDINYGIVYMTLYEIFVKYNF